MAAVEHVVADAGAFLRDAALQDIGKNIYTIRDVVSEIRDKATRRRLAVLPYELRFKEPFPEYVRLVTEFSKKTGDYPSLSATDIQVLALTYQLEAEFVGVSHLKQEPEKVKVSSSIQHPETPLHISGFHLPSKPKPPQEAVEHGPPAGEPEDLEFSSFMFWRNPLPNIDRDLQELLSDEGEEEEEKEEDGCEERKAEGSDDEEGWITPSNIKQIQRELEQCTIPKDVRVGCVTTDFAMQNVLLQMGLHVLAVNGMLIREARSYILRCHGCFKTTSDMSRVFCSHCGNKTLKKVSVTVSDDGTLHMHFSRNPKVLNARGLRYSLPTPKGGKYAVNPHLTEDQRFPQLRLSHKARQKTDVFAPDYVAGASPFAENDISSRSAMLQVRDNTLGAGRRRLNPNASRKKFVKKR
ncbi:NIN1 (RPN12) binding protein 1-like protein [Rhinolophus ferrumequinum]|uniref:RNA-binding protein NOB1 n=1 Tax=Rhinolophus ferrumequinum TaxID=59479 RepID=A0A671ECD5_RHIFE|nr:RNA-binding protein NOB1 [Rhinolophus ferrumequinum]KAF6288677.1 NIN1 (RPN12) binding protein 1-like protein [Rhinolophus ferrumequinum]